MTMQVTVAGSVAAKQADAVVDIPPHDMNAEAAVLSAVMLDPEALPRVIDFLRVEHFFSEAHRRIYEAAIALYEAKSVVDVLTIEARLRVTGRLAQVGGAGYLTQIHDATPAHVNVRAHATIVFELWRTRTIIGICQRAAKHGYRDVADAQLYADQVARAIAQIGRQRAGTKVETNFDALTRVVRLMYLAENPSAKGDEEAKHAKAVPTGIRAYDQRTLGLHIGQKTTVVAHPRVGKTAFALHVAIKVAQGGLGVAFFSTEMTRDELADRQLANLSGVDSRRIQQAKQKPILSAEEWRRIYDVMGDAERVQYKLSVYDDPSPTVEDICAQATAQAEQSMAVDGVPLGLIVVDYVQKLRASPAMENRPKVERIGHATERLKVLARDLKVPLIELAQQKKGEADRSRPRRSRPALGDAADCYQIERSADNVVYIYRPEENDGRNVRVFLAKQRSGEEDEIDLVFEQAFSRFVDPNTPNPMANPSRQYIDTKPDPEPPAGFFDRFTQEAEG